MKLFVLVLLFATLLSAENITLPKPTKSGGKALYTVLNTRGTSREFAKEKALTKQQVSQVLWAAAGRNRTEAKQRTAPSAWGNNEVSLYVLLKTGVYKYDAVTHQLLFIAAGDKRTSGGKQDFVADAPMTIVLVGDLSKITQSQDKDANLRTAYLDAGYISQNIYLAAESEGLVTGARAWLDHQELKSVLKLSETEHVIVANSVGYGK